MSAKTNAKLKISSAKTWIIHVTEKIRASTWTIPTASVIGAILLSQLCLFIDTKSGDAVTDFIKIWSESSANALLTTIASSTLALAGVAFSSILVTMTLASEQFGPGLLRNFVKDRSSQISLAVLMATFVYCLFVIRGPRSNQGEGFIPHLSLMFATVLAIVSLFFFILFIQHVLTLIQVETVVADAHNGLIETIENTFPDHDEGEQEQQPEPEEGKGWEVTSGKDGYIQAIDYEALVKYACQQDVVLWVVCRPGWFITKRRPVVRVVEGAEDKGAIDSHPSFEQCIQDCFYVGSCRTPEQDIEYGIRQIVGICLRALSTNDPFTAIDCIDYLGSALETIFARPLPGSVLLDEDNTVRVIRSVTEYEGLVDAAVDQVRQASRGDCAVSCQLLDMLKKVGKQAHREDQRQALLHQAGLIHRDTVPQMSNDHDREAIRSRYQEVVKACDLAQAT